MQINTKKVFLIFSSNLNSAAPSPSLGQFLNSPVALFMGAKQQ